MLQWFALVSMAIDHAGVILGWGEWADCIGRFAFPVFAFLVARNVSRSSQPWCYVRRMLLWGMVAQPVFMVAFAASGFRFNVLFTLALIASACLALRRDRLWLLGLCVVLGHWCDYGILGVLFGLSCFVSLRARQWWLTAAILAVGFTPPIFAPVVLLALLCCFFSVCPVGAWMDWRPGGARARWIVSRFFYAFYPVHLALLLGISVFPLLG